MRLDRATGVHQSLGFNVGLTGKLFRWERPEENNRPIDCDICLPLLVVLANTEGASQAVGPRLPLVLSVSNPRYVAQIGNPIVRWVSVNVVNLLSGPFARNVQPSKSVGEVDFPLNRDFNSSAFVQVPDHLTNFSDLVENNPAGEYTGFTVVRNKFSQPFSGKRSVNNLWRWQSRIKEVADPVIAAVFVFAAKVFVWKLTVHIQPCQSGSVIRGVVNVDRDSSGNTLTACNVTSKRSSTPCEPSKNAGLWVVVEKFAQSCCGKIGLNHDVVPHKQLIGEKPRSVSALSGLRYFTGQPSNLQHAIGV